jgi:hypothetical protein
MEESIDEKELKWKQFDKMASQIKMNLRPLVLSMNVKSQSSSHSLKQDIESLQNGLRKRRSFAPPEVNYAVFNKATRKYIVPGGEIIPSRYEFQL